MQFITHGPDIPDALLQAHEEGNVVFFCGAGISYPAGLPGFKGLVNQIYDLNGTTFEDIEREAFNRGQYDATLDLLERRIPGQRLAVRRALAQALKPKLRRMGSTDSHAALLRLARSRQGALRLVTTNFDRVFHTAAKRTGQPFESYAAPMLPIPKNSRWDGIVYLHGLLPDKSDDTALNRLVVTSGDFGLAYLTERWAARFVSELFRNYVVCFVGYSINDPVLRYMMDALAADRMLGEATPQAWALGECEPGQEKNKAIEWEAKGVTPILYSVLDGAHDHSALHKTLHAWADTYRDGVLGKERIVVSHALARPSASTQQDDFVGRMLWALSDPSGLPAKRFADFNPVPPLDWLLEAFTQERFQHGDLKRFGVPAPDEPDAKLRFSMIQRPAPYGLAPRMQLACMAQFGSQWDDVMHHLARWLLRHLDDPRLVLWIAERGGKLHDRWLRMIESELNRLATLAREGKTAELEDIQAKAPNAIPRPAMLKLWHLIIGGRLKSPNWLHNLYGWKDRLKSHGLTASLRFELRRMLAPQVRISSPFHWACDEVFASTPNRIKHLVDWELVLASDHANAFFRELKDKRWPSALPELFEDLQQLLCDAMDLLRELGEADDRNDPSHWHLQSIIPHNQNRHSHDWVTLVELLRDSWLTIYCGDRTRAMRLAEAWFDKPYPVFKRLALFAASKCSCINCEHWVNWLLVNDRCWLWSINTRREVCRLLVLQGSRLKGAVQVQLETAILYGPPREMYKPDLEPKKWNEIAQRVIWLLLAKLNASNLNLGTSAKTRLIEISTAHPQWKLAANESDEFAFWMSGSGDPDYEEWRHKEVAPRKRRELVKWLTTPQTKQVPFYEDDWRDVCRTRFFHVLCALHELARNGVWLTERWREALQVWSEDALVVRSWRYAASIVQAMPDAIFEEIVHGITCWMEAISKSINVHEHTLLELCQRVLALPLEADAGMIENGKPIERPVTDAINHPVGNVTQTLINLWLIRKPNDNDLLPDDIKVHFTRLCDVRISRYRHGRVLLGARLIALFRVDRPWTEKCLLPLLDWSHSSEAKGVWEGFLWSPRMYQPLLVAFKGPFLECARHYSLLGEHGEQYAAFLTYLALGPTDGYTVNDLRSAITALPQEGLEEAAQALFQALEGSADQCEDYWRNRILPFWKQIWPKSRELATPRIAESVARLIIAARGEFPAAFLAVKDWLEPIEQTHYIVHLLHESGLCRRFPVDALNLLDVLISDQEWSPTNLGQCLDEIEQAAPASLQDPKYQRLRAYFRRRGA